MSEELKPCPALYCKSTDLEIHVTAKPPGAFDEHRVRCLQCGTTGPKGVMPGQAKAVWNALPRGPEIGPAATKATRRLVECLGPLIADKTGYSGIYLICADGARVASQCLMCVTDSWDVVHEQDEAKGVGR